MCRNRKRTRNYSIAEAERIAERLPLQRRYSPIEAAHAVAQYLYPDPAFWVEQAGLASMRAGFDGVDKDQKTFLMVWAALTDADDAIKAFLINRSRSTC